MNYIIKSLDHTQIKELKDLAFEFAKEGNKKLNWDHWCNVNSNLIKNKMSVSEAVYHKGNIIGFGIIHFFPDFISGETFAIDGAFFISQKYRGLKCAKLLLDVLEMHAKKENAKKIIMVAMDSISEGKAGVFFKRKGYKVTETFYEKDL